MSYQTHKNKCILTYTNVNPLRQAWCKLLDHYRWTYFVTLTFRDLPKSYTAINRATQFLRYVDKTICEKIAYYIAMEFTMAGTPHFHLLLGNLEGSRYSIFTEWWFSKYGYARFKVYDPKKGATHYLTKYVVKDKYQTGWYEIKGLQYLDQYLLTQKIKSV